MGTIPPRSTEQLRIVVGGFLGLLPAAGVAWDYAQYPAGFAAMGHDVYYIEDTRLWPIYQGANTSGDSRANVAHLADVMLAFGLAERWAYRDEVSGTCFGLSETRVLEICRSADLFVNVSCASVLRDEYKGVPARVLIDTDPMFTQIQYVAQEGFTAGAAGIRDLVAGHTHCFTFGESIGLPECRIPDCGITWRPTRQPVCLPRWVSSAPTTPGAPFTTVMNWAAGRTLQYDGQRWGQKDVELLRLIDLPAAVPELQLSLVIGQTTGTPFPAEDLRRKGWRLLDPAVTIPNWWAYKTFITNSCGEFSVAKETYVKARTGWFSCRSACYLAAGRPVVAQDTGWSRHIPAGPGLLAFTTPADAAAALAEVAMAPAAHSAGARAIAEEYFAAERVLGGVLAEIGA